MTVSWRIHLNSLLRLLPLKPTKSRLLNMFRTYSPVSSPCSLHNAIDGKLTSVTGWNKIRFLAQYLPHCRATIGSGIRKPSHIWYILHEWYLRKCLDDCDPWLLQPIWYGRRDDEARANETSNHYCHPKEFLHEVVSSDPVRKTMDRSHLARGICTSPLD